MDKAEWLKQVNEHASVLRSLIIRFHPATADGPRKGIGKITAPMAERAAEHIREKIAVEDSGKGSPLTRFDQALKDEDAGEIYSLLQSAWFGVPESTACWQVEGFKEAVDLMDDPPDPTEEEMANG